MTLSELVLHVGDENIVLQYLNQDLAGVTVGKQDAKVTFFASRANGLDLTQSVALGEQSKNVGIILWIPRDKMPAGISH